MDSPAGDPEFNAFLDEWHAVATLWPNDWRNSALDVTNFFRVWGCDYFYMNSAPSDWDPHQVWYPADFPFGIDPCSNDGDFFPVREHDSA